MNVVFIAYFYKPYPGVGAKRITYWAENITQFNLTPIIVTATEPDETAATTKKTFIVKNTQKKRLGSFVIKDYGYSWTLDLKKFFQSTTFTNVKAFVISGGPFMQFEIAEFLKKKYPDSLMVFDYRDPFAINPRFNDNIIKRTIKKYFEKKFNTYADKIITVNKYCANLIQTEKTINIIDNGYDESVLTKTLTEIIPTKNTIIHSGSFFTDRNPISFLNVVSKSNFTFLHYGNQSPYFNKFKHIENIKEMGFVPYTTVLEKIAHAEIAVLFTSGDPFESTTKIFDYIALNKKILLITEGELFTGALGDITKKYPNIVWSKNNESDINNALKILSEKKLEPFDASFFSRKASLQKLTAVLNE